MIASRTDNKSRWPRWVVPAYLVLFALGVPWYFPEGQTGPLVWGIPLWAAVSLGCSVAVSVLTAYLALRRWPDVGRGDGDGI